MNLFEIGKDFLQVLELYENCEDENKQELEEMLHNINVAFENKIENCLYMLKITDNNYYNQSLIFLVINSLIIT